MTILSEKVLNELKYDNLLSICIIIFISLFMIFISMFVTRIYEHIPEIVTNILSILLFTSFISIGILSIIEQPCDIKQYNVYVDDISIWETLQDDYIIVEISNDDIHYGVIQDKEPPPKEECNE